MIFTFGFLWVPYRNLKERILEVSYVTIRDEMPIILSSFVSILPPDGDVSLIPKIGFRSRKKPSLKASCIFPELSIRSFCNTLEKF